MPILVLRQAHINLSLRYASNCELGFVVLETSMKIAQFVFVVLLMLGGVSVFLSAGRFWYSHQTVIEDEQLAELAEAKSSWLEGTVALSFERSVTQVALALDTPIPAEFRALIDEQRSKSDQLLEGTMIQLQALEGFENGALFFEQVGLAQRGITQLRREADELLSKFGEERNSVRVKALPYEIKTKIEDLYASAALLVIPGARTSTDEISLNRIQSLAWEIREYGGRARTFYAIATLTGTPIPENLMGEAIIDTARAKAGWHQLKLATQAVDLPTQLVQAIENTERPFVQNYLASLDELDIAMAEMRSGVAREMPIEFAEFFGMSNVGLDAVAGLAPVAGTHILAYWEEELSYLKTVRALNIGIMVVAIGLTFLSLFALQKKLVRPLTAVTEVLLGMVDGKLDREFRKTPRGVDEMRVLWDALRSLTETLRSARDNTESEKEAEKAAKEGIIGDLLIGLEKMAQGDLTHHIQNQYGPTYEGLVENFNATTDTLRRLVADVVDNAAEIADHSVELSQGIKDLSRRTEAQASSLAETVENLNEFSEKIREAAEGASQSNGLVGQATENAKSGLDIVEGAVDSMNEIKTSSQEINNFTTVIEEIAFQTGLLALNASVEASRAGDSGKGFAVVASEIRSLAQRASESSKEIKDVVQQSVKQVEMGANQVSKTGKSLEDIAEMVQRIRSRIASISDASQDQKSGVNEIGLTMEHLDEMTRQNATMVDQATLSSATLQQKAQALRAAVERFSIDDAAGHAEISRAA
ncbi:MAG: methyl-accepting chemotaxis protein [Litoreibacter sp.]|nr:methyl-accepting chemotaxis protein [Litoreibacter sp.]